MCIISQPAHVSATKIFVALNGSQTRQLTVYANTTSISLPGTVMILPVPEPATVEMIDLSGYADIFTDLNRPFLRRATSRSLDFSTNSYSAKSLHVAQVGSYEVSVAASATILAHLNPETFGIVDEAVRDALNLKYPGYGFVACKLRAGDNVKHHPIAYTHAAPRDKNGTMFVPTYHLHRHTPGGAFEEEAEAEWDHEIFVLNGSGPLSYQTMRAPPSPYVKWHEIPFAFPSTCERLLKATLVGTRKNEDLIFFTDIPAEAVSLKDTCLVQ